MWENRSSYNGLSVLPYDGGTYTQAPFEDCSKETFEAMLDSLTSIDLTRVTEEEDNTDLKGEAACAGGACEVKFVQMITLSESAAKKMKAMLLNKEETGVRAAVQGGGCSGFTYKLLFDDKNETDRVLTDKGVEIYIDNKSFLYLMGTMIDFVDELNQSGFKFVNPNAKRTCGCGESFSI